MRAIACLSALAFLTCAPGRAEDFQVKDVTISVEQLALAVPSDAVRWRPRPALSGFPSHDSPL